MPRTKPFLEDLTCALARSSPAFTSGGTVAGPNPPLLVALRRDGPAYGGRTRDLPTYGLAAPALAIVGVCAGVATAVSAGGAERWGALLLALALAACAVVALVPRDMKRLLFASNEVSRPDHRHLTMTRYVAELAHAACLSEWDQHTVLAAAALLPGEHALPAVLPLGRFEFCSSAATDTLRDEQLRAAAVAVRARHEHFDGTGVPDRLAGDEIPVAARILAVVELYGTLTMPGGGWPAMPPVLACELLRDAAGTRLDPELAHLFVDRVVGSDK